MKDERDNRDEHGDVVVINCAYDQSLWRYWSSCQDQCAHWLLYQNEESVIASAECGLDVVLQ